MKSLAVLPLLSLVLVSLCGHQVPPPPSDVSGTVYSTRTAMVCAIHAMVPLALRGSPQSRKMERAFRFRPMPTEHSASKTFHKAPAA